MRMFVERAWALSLTCWPCEHEALIWPDKLEARFGLDRTIGDLVGHFKCTQCPSKQITIYPKQTGGYGWGAAGREAVIEPV